MTKQKHSFTLVMFSIITFILTLNTQTRADSVYAIPNQHDDSLNVYEISENGSLDYRATYDLIYNRPVDVTIDTRSNILFVTFEFQNEIELINARTFLSEGTVDADEASNLAGVVLDYIDSNTVRLYIIDRGTNKLFVYDWDAVAGELTLIPPNPSTGNDYNELVPSDLNLVSEVKGTGLAFDPNTSTLYVSQFNGGYSRYVHAFDRNNNWEPVRTIDLGQHEGKDNYAVDIDVDSENGWLYAGGYTSHDNLIS